MDADGGHPGDGDEDAGLPDEIDAGRDESTDASVPEGTDASVPEPDSGTLPDEDKPPEADEDPTPDGAKDADAEPEPIAEMLLFDGDDRQFSYDDNGFHALIRPGDDLPANDWISPVDYYNGEFHIRYIINAPADQQAGILQTCIWTMGDDGVGGNYFPESCSQQVAHTGVGQYPITSQVSPAAWWMKDTVPLDFAHPERFLIRVVLRGTSGCNVTRHNVSNPCWEEWPKYENMRFRVTIVMVGSGASFSGWERYP